MNRSEMSMRDKRAGFTLVELMMVVAVVSILVAIAYPAYTQQMLKGRRTAAQSDLMELAQFMQRYYSENKRYRDSLGAAPALPFTQSPKDSSSKVYDLTVATASDTSYTLTATPIAGGPQADNGKLTLDQTGDRCWDENDDNTCAVGEDWD